MEERLRMQVLTIARLAADRAALALDLGDQALASLVADLDPGDFPISGELSADVRTRLQTALTDKRARFNGVSTLALTDVNGSTLAHSGPVDASARPLAAALVTQALAADTTRDSARSATGIHLSRRIERDGQAVGYAVAEVAAVGDGTRVLAALDAGDTAILSNVYSGPLGSVDYVLAPATGITQMVTRVKLPRYPLYLTYGKDIDDLVAMWRYEKLIVTAATLLAVIVSAIVTAGIRRRMTLTMQLQTVRSHLIDSNNALRSALAASELVAAKDQLTGLWNRRTFDQRLQEAIAHHGRHDGVFSLLLLDLDHFKSINDRHGHVTGDDVLKRFADILHERLRQNDVHARWGGEEFAILADGADLERAFLLAEHIRQAVEKTRFDGPAQVTVSIGVAEYVPEETGDDLLVRADGALYEAKRTGRNRVVAASGLALGDRYFIGLTDESAPLFAQDFAH